ncbi:MAG: hypothetical protein JWM85_1479 [Acidimicrobiaceae bacterium]|nr:hypothetical protein [Acidimicrobiaceae bacterium]
MLAAALEAKADASRSSSAKVMRTGARNAMPEGGETVAGATETSRPRVHSLPHRRGHATYDGARARVGAAQLAAAGRRRPAPIESARSYPGVVRWI